MPIRFTEYIFNLILERIEEGETLSEICGKDRDKTRWPSRRAFNNWVSEDEELGKRFGAAMDLRDEEEFDRALAVAKGDGGLDTTEKIQRDRLHVDTIKWRLGQRKPRKYGQRAYQPSEDTGGDQEKPTKTIEYHADPVDSGAENARSPNGG